MQQSFKHYVIVPIHNEEKNLEIFLNSMINQTEHPNQIILVDDHSTDNTPKIISKYCSKYPKIRSILSSNTSHAHEPGAKIIQVFYDGFETIKNLPFDLITKMDSDLELPPNYFETIHQMMWSNPKLGIVGGVCTIFKKNKWVLEKAGNKDHVRGALKSYRRNCFEAIKKLRTSFGWDVIDELLALYHGFEIETIPHLKVKHLKPTGILYKKNRGISMGRSMYMMRYGFLITGIAALKISYLTKSTNMLMDILIGYRQAFKNKVPKIVSEEEGKWIRAYRWNGVRQKIFGAIKKPSII